MRTEGNAQAAVQADKRFPFLIDKNGIDGAGGCACTASIAQLFLEDHSAIATRLQGPGGTDLGAWRRGAGQAMHGGEAGGQAAGRMDPNPRGIPGEATMEQTGAGQGTGVATDTSVHAWRGQNVHRCSC